MSENLDVWNRFADIDPKFTKPITGKPYKGTSPNPQYIIQCLTEMFGPVGKGFGWNIIAEEFTPLGDTFLHWCRIEFWWKQDGSERQSFEEYGQTKAAYKTSTGSFMVDEDAPKKSLTDAIIKAASHLGVASSIFLGRWDDQKYVAEVNKEYREAEHSERTTEKPQGKPTRDAANSTEQQPISAAEQKRQCEEIDKDLLDCKSVIDVNKCAKIWASIMDRDGWSKMYRDFAVPKFNERRTQLQREQEAA
jgi:hypothetical protein